jgi:hypothetical protein
VISEKGAAAITSRILATRTYALDTDSRHRTHHGYAPIVHAPVSVGQRTASLKRSDSQAFGTSEMHQNACLAFQILEGGYSRHLE